MFYRWFAVAGAVIVLMGVIFLRNHALSQRAFAAPSAQNIPLISVGSNVQVSVDSNKRIHDEVLIGANPKNSNELIACVIGEPTGARIGRLAAYRSSDAGTSWHLAGQFRGGHLSVDPICSFGVTGTAYFGGSGQPVNADMTPDRGNLSISFHRFAPNGTLLPRFQLPGSAPTDRPFLAVDYGSKYHGNVYISAKYETLNPFRSGMALWTSRNDGRSFGLPVTTYPPDKGIVSFAGQNAVLRDGTVAVAFTTQSYSPEQVPPEPSQPGMSFTNKKIFIAVSVDGGKTLSAPVVVTTVKQDDYQFSQFGSGCILQLAADETHGPYGGRLYLAWGGFVAGRTRVRLAHSDDRGKHWSLAQDVSDERAADGSIGDQVQPTIAVNNRGVLGITWLDKRNLSDPVASQTRFTASLDGGETFLPSVPVAEVPNQPDKADRDVVTGVDYDYRYAYGGAGGAIDAKSMLPVNLYENTWPSGGHTSGLVADASGVFHALWADNRTGSDQMWTAAVTVAGTSQKHGGGELASLADQSDNVSWYARDADFNRASQIETVYLVLKNTGHKPLQAPLYLRVLAVGSPYAKSVVIMDSANGKSGPGAALDLSPYVGSHSWAVGKTIEIPVRLQSNGFSLPTRYVQDTNALFYFNAIVLGGQ